MVFQPSFFDSLHYFVMKITSTKKIEMPVGHTFLDKVAKYVHQTHVSFLVG